MRGPFRRLGDLVERKITEAQTCPRCGCNADRRRPDCDCLRQGCQCAGADEEDNPGWEREPGPDAVIVDAAGGHDLPPAAEPCTPRNPTPTRPTTAPTTTGSAGGAGMSSIEEVRAGIALAGETANEGFAGLQQALAALEQAQAGLSQATEGSTQADVSTALGLFAQAISTIEEGRQQVSAGISAAEDVANRL